MAGFFVQWVWLVPLLPLLGGLIGGFGATRFRFNAAIPLAIGIGASFLFSLGSWASAGPETTIVVSKWLAAGSFQVPIELRVDGLSTLMLSMVTFVSFLVVIFASGYMAGDPAYPRFFAFVGMFVFSMTGLVLSNNFLLTYAFWEGVGVCSYLLIGFWYARKSAADAAMKAFLVNRLGDIGFAIAIFWLWMIVPNHDLSYTNVLAEGTLASLPDSARIGIPLLLFWAATAKSAQLPLYVWLPDAMEGPTPVSALIHAATMVTAGVYLIARSTALLALAPGVQLLICVVGCATALLAAAIALTQNDLKRVMAYSTVSQLGYMFMALGAGVGNLAQLAIIAAIFHLFTHAFFKALLFLASGSVMHSMGDVIDMRRFRGLRRRLPYTCWTFAIGGLALAGIFPMAGFFSKDEILLALAAAPAEARSVGLTWGWVYGFVYWMAILTAFMTAFYTGRAFFMTFWGPEKLPSPDDPEAPRDEGHVVEGDDPGHGHHHVGEESAPVMTIPLMILAGCAVLAGVVFGPTGLLEHHLKGMFGFESLGHAEHQFGWGTPVLGLVVGLAGIALSYLLYAQPSPAPARLASTFRPLYLASLNKFYVDEIYQWTVMKVLWVSAAVLRFLDIEFVERTIVGIATAPRAIGRNAMAVYQNGLIQFYAAATAASVAILLLLLLFS